MKIAPALSVFLVAATGATGYALGRYVARKHTPALPAPSAPVAPAATVMPRA